MRVSRLSICRCRNKCRQSKRRIFEQIAAPSVHPTKCSKAAFRIRSSGRISEQRVGARVCSDAFLGRPCPLSNRVPHSSAANPMPFCRKPMLAGLNSTSIRLVVTQFGDSAHILCLPNPVQWRGGEYQTNFIEIPRAGSTDARCSPGGEKWDQNVLVEAY